MSLSQRNEWIVVCVLILYIAFVPSFPFVQDMLGSSVGKAVGLAAVIYVWKTVSEPVAILLLVAILRSGAIREYADDPSMKPVSSDPPGNCEAGYEPDLKTMMCKKGNETKAMIICQPSEEWDPATSRCKPKGGDKPPPVPPMGSGGAGGPAGGTTPSAAAQMSAMADLKADPTVEKFSPYEKPSNGGFSPL
jgi:hypothetical protein